MSQESEFWCDSHTACSYAASTFNISVSASHGVALVRLLNMHTFAINTYQTSRTISQRTVEAPKAQVKNKLQICHQACAKALVVKDIDECG